MENIISHLKKTKIIDILKIEYKISQLKIKKL